MSPGPRTILHVDLDAFYASVEQRDDPKLRGRPVIVGGDSKRGVVCAASYEARPFGVHSAMPTARAHQLCPDAVFLRPRLDYYGKVSRQFFDILESFTPRCEGLSLDEAFLDVSDVRSLWGDGPTVAQKIKKRVQDDLQLVASVGVAPNKFVAKIGSDLEKPDGLVVVRAGELNGFLSPLPVSRLWGVGKVTEKALSAIGVRTIGEVAQTPRGFLEARLGRSLGRHLHELAIGQDDREVVCERAAVSIGHEDTFEEDIGDRERLVAHLLDQSDRVAARLRANDLRARVVTLKIKFADFRRITRRQTLDSPSQDGQVIGRTASRLLGRVKDVEKFRVRLTGVSVSELQSAEDNQPVAGQADQLSFAALAAPPDPGQVRGEKLGQTLDAIKTRYGGKAIRRAVHVDDGALGARLRDAGQASRRPKD